MEVFLKFLFSLIALIVGLFLTQPTYATNILNEPVLDIPMGVFMTTNQDVLVELNYKAMPMVTSALWPSHRNVTNIIKTDKFVNAKVSGIDSQIMEVETVLKFPYLIRLENRKKDSRIGMVGLLV